MAWAFVEHLYARCATHPDPDRWATLVEMFIEDSGERVARLEEAVRSGDTDEAYALAHSLRGGSATFGARRMLELSSEVESLVGGGELAAAAGVVGRLSSEYDLVVRALARVGRGSTGAAGASEGQSRG